MQSVKNSVQDRNIVQMRSTIIEPNTHWHSCITGAIHSFAMSDERKRIVWNERIFGFDHRVFDFDVNGNDLHVCVDQRIEYHKQDRFFHVREAIKRWTTESLLRSIAINPDNLLAEVCTGTGCSLLDGQTPQLIGLAEGRECRRILPSSSMDVVPIRNSESSQTIDLRWSEDIMAG
jgi:hypothetical protein